MKALHVKFTVHVKNADVEHNVYASSKQELCDTVTKIFAFADFTGYTVPVEKVYMDIINSAEQVKFPIVEKNIL